jgi:hypothetical protein
VDFAGILLMMAGVLNIIWSIAAIAETLFALRLSSDELYAARSAPGADWADARRTVESRLSSV